ncbi:ABC transporter substrate-binding protein [Breznakiellaceae bacterium SP9]
MKKIIGRKAGLALCLLFCLAAAAFAAPSKDTSAAKPKALPKEINVSYVESPFNLQCMVMHDQKLLEKAFASRNIRVNWHNINSGADQMQAMAAGSLDIGSVVNSTSIILANAAGNSVEIAAMVSRPKQSFALLVGPNGPKTVAELKGRTVAGPKGTVLQQMLVAALVSEGLRANDVNFIQMGLPEARAALLSGQIDGALQAAALIIRGQEAGLRVLLTADGYLTPLLLTAVRPAFARDYPELLQIYLDVQKEAATWILAHPDDAVAIGARYQQIAFEDGQRLYTWNGIASTLEESDVTALAVDVQFLLDQGMIERSVNPRDFIRPQAFAQ